MSRPAPAGAPNGYRNMSNGSNLSVNNVSTNSIANNPAGMSSQTRVANMSRAERFEDEKRRIIESCFSKLDQNGQLAESYITHIRVQEDGIYQSSPPPPESAQDNKKPRLIIIAVRATGRVRMHKARENNNGSFSIGKTWNLEDLSSIESYANTSEPPQNDQERDYRAWAGSVGFSMTITKPYYWQAGTAKEKEFFIASAVKIYRKYTKGQVPELRGFDESQKFQMIGSMPGPAQSPPPPQPPQHAARLPDETQSPTPPRPPFAQEGRPRSRDDSRYRGSPGPPPSLGERDSRNSSNAATRNPSESPARMPPAGPAVPKPFASTEQLRSQSQDGRQESRPGTSPGPGGLRSPPPTMSQMPRAPSQQSSHSQLRSESPANLNLAAGREGSAKLPPFAPQSPSRNPSYGQSMDGVSTARQMPLSPGFKGPNGASAFPPTQQRGPDRRERDLSPSQTPGLPPIDTTPFMSGASPAKHSTPASGAPKTSESELSSAGVRSGDASVFASATGFIDSAKASNGTPTVNAPPSPPAPARSTRRRPTIEHTMSDSTVEQLRPPPLLNQHPTTQRSLTPDPASLYTTPQGTTTPTEESLQVKPLSPTKNKSDSNLPMPGGFQRTPLGASPLSTPAETPTEEKSEDIARQPEEAFRPGLGPMIKKKAVADRMKKAAFAANAFKPRAGGAAEKILKAKAEREANNEPDGITGVVPRPAPKQESTKEEAPAQPTDDLAVKEPVRTSTPKVEVFSPTSPANDYVEQKSGSMDKLNGVQLTDEAPRDLVPDLKGPEELEKERLEQRQTRQPQVKVKKRTPSRERYLEELGIDRSILANKGLDFEQMMYDFGWKDASLSPKALADMEADLRREQSRLDAGSWLSGPTLEAHARQERETQVLNMIDKAVQECDEMDGLLTLYNVELNSLSDDVTYIEAQSQGLQVQAANQRNLEVELRNLVQTLSLDRKSLAPLRQADLSNSRGLDDAEQCLKGLYQALISIDPSIRSAPSGRPRSRNGMLEGSEMSNMAAVREKRQEYLQQSDVFCQRLMEQLDSTFGSTFGNAKNQAVVVGVGGNKHNTDAYTSARKSLWVYSPLILFTKELNPPAWQTLLRMYHTRAKPMYAEAFGQSVASWKKAVRKPTGDEGELLFTAQEREEPASGGVVSSARKLTVKRSQTLAKTLRNASGEKPSPADSKNTGSLQYCEAFSGAVDEMAPLMSQEQNFVVDLFHATSLETSDFMDIVSATPPEQRYGTNLIERKPLDPDRELARQVTSVMDQIFGFFSSELSSLLDWSVSIDPIQGIGVMACLGRHSYFLQDTSQEFLIQMTDTLMARLQSLFAKFVDEQIRAIEDTKVKIKKRKGVIGFMKIFPHFSAAVENTFAAVGQADYEHDEESMAEVRRRVDEAYERINRAMFDSLKVIAKESPTAAPQSSKAGASDDPEDKEKLNYHVLLIENMNHYIEEVDDGGRQGALAEWKGRAETERAEALDAYVGQVIRRPLGKLLEFLDSIDSVRESHATNPTSITSRPSFSRKNARSMLATYDPKEVRRGIDQLRTRIEKHFGHADDEAISRALVALVCKECEKAYETTIERVESMISELYPPTDGEKAVELDFARADVQGAFRK